MIFNDQKKDHEREVALVEYLAAFWNPESVKKIQNSRADAAKHKFQDNHEFEQSVLSGEFKSNPLLETIKQLGILNNKNKKVSVDKSGKRKQPTNLANLKQTIESFK